MKKCLLVYLHFCSQIFGEREIYKVYLSQNRQHFCCPSSPQQYRQSSDIFSSVGQKNRPWQDTVPSLLLSQMSLQHTSGTGSKNERIRQIFYKKRNPTFFENAMKGDQVICKDKLHGNLLLLLYPLVTLVYRSDIIFIHLLETMFQTYHNGTHQVQ